ncbi:Kinesin-like protein [Actinidia chinensis var. chinensis]|uniref:Kinesin-like protein n=1 Tax=Actinidia chinensis var. chinensis TaxID=1590841 RepID=A0A2R6RBT5_ACTCC|nr:Kinesin-like protein [Actinidia chinensis var. chinensis]
MMMSCVDKIQRMTSLVGGLIFADYFLKESIALSKEIQLLQAKIDRNPEVTCFSMENIRILEQLRRISMKWGREKCCYLYHLVESKCRLYCSFLISILFLKQVQYHFGTHIFQDLYEVGEGEMLLPVISCRIQVQIILFISYLHPFFKASTVLINYVSSWFAFLIGT